MSQPVLHCLLLVWLQLNILFKAFGEAAWKQLCSLLFLDYSHGLEPCPICLGEPKDPVCLPCNHVFCHKCISLWLVPAQMLCPYCRVAMDDVELTVSEELRYSSHPLQGGSVCWGGFVRKFSILRLSTQAEWQGTLLHLLWN